MLTRPFVFRDAMQPAEIFSDCFESLCNRCRRYRVGGVSWLAEVNLPNQINLDNILGYRVDLYCILDASLEVPDERAYQVRCAGMHDLTVSTKSETYVAVISHQIEP